MSYPQYSFHTEDHFMGSGNRFSASNIPDVEFDFDDPASSEDAFWESSPVTCHSPAECKECRMYSDHLHATSLSGTAPAQQYSFVDGVRIGRRIQEEEDSNILSRYRSRLQLAHTRHRESLILKAKFRSQVEILERELVAVKDRLMAVQIAYEDLSMARIDDMPPSSWSSGSSDPWEAVRSSIRSPSPPFPAADPEDSDVPLVVRELEASYYLHDEDDFEVLQQLQMMDEREKDTGAFWTDFRSRNLSDDSSDGLGGSSIESDTESSPSSFSSVTSSTADHVLSDDSAADIPKNVVETSTESAIALDIAQLNALMISAHESGNTAALNRVRTLIQEAERTPKRRRTSTQLYLMTHWRNPSRSPSSSPPLLPSTFRPQAAPSSSSTPEIFVDASGHGIGFVFNNRWLAWTFAPNHPHIPIGPDKKIIMSWAELIAVELGILTLLAGGYRDRRILVRSDNEGVVTALTKKTWTENHGLGMILARILRMCEDAKVELKMEWVWTKMNPADGPSRGTYPPADMMLSHAPSIPQHLVGLLRQVGAV